MSCSGARRRIMENRARILDQEDRLCDLVIRLHKMGYYSTLQLGSDGLFTLVVKSKKTIAIWKWRRRARK